MSYATLVVMRRRWIVLVLTGIVVLVAAGIGLTLYLNRSDDANTPPPSISALGNSFRYLDEAPVTSEEIEERQRDVERKFTLPPASVKFERVEADPSNIEVYSLIFPGSDSAGPLAYVKWGDDFLTYGLNPR